MKKKVLDKKQTGLKVMPDTNHIHERLFARQEIGDSQKSINVYQPPKSQHKNSLNNQIRNKLHEGMSNMGDSHDKE